MEYEKKQDPMTPPPPYATAPYQPGPGVPYNQPYSQRPYPEGPYSPQQAPSPPGGYSQQAGGYYPAGQYQQPTHIVVQAQPVVYSGPQQFVSMIGAIVLSCFVFWCCGIICGSIAFILAMIGQSSSSDGNSAGAIRLRNASYAVSVVGIVVGIAAIVTFVLLTNSNRRHYY